MSFPQGSHKDRLEGPSSTARTFAEGRWEGRIDAKRLGRWISVLALLILIGPLSFGHESSIAPLQPEVWHNASVEDLLPHRFRVDLFPGIWGIELVQEGFDAILEGSISDGTQLPSVDSPIRAQGPEFLVLEATRQVVVDLLVRPDQAASARGGFRLRVRRIETTKGWVEAMAGGAAFHLGTPESRREALGHFQRARKLFQTEGETKLAAWALGAKAALLARGDEASQAHRAYLELLQAWEVLDEPLRQAAALNNLGLLERKLGQADQAVTHFRSALRIYQDHSEPRLASIVQNNLCLLHHGLGRLDVARGCYEKVLADPLGGTDEAFRATVQNNLGGVFYQQGEPARARRFFTEALRRRQELGDLRGQAELLNNLASLARTLGYWQEALDHYHRALEIQGEIQDRWREAKTRNNIGRAYLQLGEPRRALPFLERALQLRKELEDPQGQAVTLSNLATLYRDLGSPAKAEIFHREALALRRDLGDQGGEARTLLALAQEQAAREDDVEARTHLGRALSLFDQLGDRPGQASVLAASGKLALDRGQWDPARRDLEASLEILRQVGAPERTAEVLTHLARLGNQEGRAEEALGLAEEAIDLLDHLRAEITDPTLRTTFSAHRNQAHEERVEALVILHHREPEAGHLARALAAADHARARGLWERLDPLGERRDVGQESVLRREAEERVRFAARRLRSRRGNKGGQEAEKALQRALAELDRLGTVPRRRAKGVSEGFDLDALTDALGPETTLLYLFLAEPRSHVFLLQNGDLRSIELPPAQELESLARKSYGSLAVLESGASSSAPAALSEALLGPVLDEVEASRLAVVADGALALIPLAALPLPGTTGQRWIDRFEVFSLPSLAVWQRLRQPPTGPGPTRTLAVLADPIFSTEDSRIHPRAAEIAAPGNLAFRDLQEASFPRLPSSRLEARAIEAMIPPEESMVLLGDEARREALLGEEISDFRILHLATHAVADDLQPELSGLVVSRYDAEGQPLEGFLDLRDLYGLELQAELVVLSGCRTAYGDAPRGEGLLGLSQAFFQAGARRVIASLWKVEDRATAQLMTYFYEAYLVAPQFPALALRQAQLKLAQESRWRDPWFWAGFVLLGEG